EPAELVSEGEGPGIHVRPQEAAPGLEADLVEAAVLLREFDEAIRMRRAHETTLRGIGPSVIGTHDRPKLRAFLQIDEARPSVAAHVVEGPCLAIRPANGEDALATDLPGEEVPRVREVFLAVQV